MTGFNGTARSLIQSLRFGPQLAVEANRWLAIADAPIRLQCTDTIPTEGNRASCTDCSRSSTRTSDEGPGSPR